MGGTPRDPITRRIVVPKVPGNLFVIADFKTIEVLIQAVIAQETNMLQVFEKGLDLHIYLATKVMNCTYQSLMDLKITDPVVYKKIRSRMKAVNFGVIFGMTEESLWEELLKGGEELTPEEASQLHQTWHSTFPKIKQYTKECSKKFYTCRASVPVLGPYSYITSLQGRLRRPEERVGIKKNGERYAYSYLSPLQIGNHPVQSTCSDFLKSSLYTIYLQLKNHYIDADIVFSVHDEIVIECPPKNVRLIKKLVENIMVGVAQEILMPLHYAAPVQVDIGVGNSWEDKP